MSHPPQQDASKSDDEHFEDAVSKDELNEKTVNEVIEQVTGLSMRQPETVADDFVDCSSNPASDSECETSPVHRDDDYIDDDAQLELERGLTDEEKEANRTLAVEKKLQGNEQFKRGEHSDSVVTYTAALRLCPVGCPQERAVLYANRAAAKAKLGTVPSAIDDCTKAIEYNPTYVKALLRRANLYEETDKLDESMEDYKKILEHDPSNAEARTAQTRLTPKIAERNERLKEEMVGKLKDLGNMILRPFGLSTQNFEMKQDPQSGSYSINFKQNNNQQ